MQSFAKDIRAAIAEYGITSISAPSQADIYTFEVDGYSSRNVMDDANILNLLAAPFFAYLDEQDCVYQATREILLSESNPYYMVGPVITGIGSVHTGPGYVWSMAVVVQILTSNDDDEITSNLQQLLRSTNGLGLLDESVNSYNQTDYTRPWFAWINGLFGQMILDLGEQETGDFGPEFSIRQTFREVEVKMACESGIFSPSISYLAYVVDFHPLGSDYALQYLITTQNGLEQITSPVASRLYIQFAPQC